MGMPRLEEVCEAIERLCGAGVPIGSHSVDPGLLEERASELLAFSRALREARADSAGGPASKTRPAAGVGNHRPPTRAEQPPLAAEAAQAPPAASIGKAHKSRDHRPPTCAEQPPFAADAAQPPPVASIGKAVAPEVLEASRCWADRAPEGEPLWSQLLSVLAVLGATLPYYACVGYTSWFVDEGFAIYRNPDARGETPVWEVLRHDFWGTPLDPPEGYNTHKSFRPLITLSFAAEWQLARRYGYQGLEMQPMRLLSCVIHSANAVAALWLLRRLRLAPAWALLGALTFAAHPVHVENIVYIVGRADALSTTFYALAVLVYLRLTLGRRPRLRWWGYAALVLLTALSGLCKETGFTALFFLACAEVVLRLRWGHVLGLLLSFAAVAGLRTWYVGGTEAGFGYVDTPIRYQDAKLTRTLSYLFQHAYYAKLLVLPWNQSWDYSYDALPMLRSLADVRMLAVVAAYLSVAAVAARGLRASSRHPAAILGLGLVVVPFIPASNLFFLVGTTVGERLLYPCTLGWAVLVAHFGSQASRSWRRLPAVAVLALVCVYAWNSSVRVGHWRNPTLLFETDAEHWSRSAKVLHSKASELQARGDLHGALDHYLKSLAVFDDQAITDYCIARIYLNLGRFQDAFQRFDKIMKGHGIGFHDGNDFLWMTDLGYLLVVLGSHEQGQHYLQEGLNRMPYSCFAWNALGVARAHLQQLQASLQAFSEGLSCDPNSASMWSNAAVVYAYANEGQQATQALERAAALNATHPKVLHNTLVLSGRAPAWTQPQFDLYIPQPGRR